MHDLITKKKREKLVQALRKKIGTSVYMNLIVGLLIIRDFFLLNKLCHQTQLNLLLGIVPHGNMENPSSPCKQASFFFIKGKKTSLPVR
jgi:hypothetical protein